MDNKNFSNNELLDEAKNESAIDLSNYCIYS